MTVAKRTAPGSYTELRMWSEAFAKAQDDRKALENLFGISVKGVPRKNLNTAVPQEAFGPVLDMYAMAEARTEKELLACYRVTVPESVQEWQRRSAGIGEHTLARLLGQTGDPRMAYPSHWEGEGTERVLVQDTPHDRSIGELWSYCGHGAQKNKAVKGDASALLANGRPSAKMLVHLLAEAQVKSNAKDGTAYRHVYDQTKAHYAERFHTSECQGGFFNGLFVKCKTHVEALPAQASPASRVAGTDPAEAAAGRARQEGKAARPGYAQAGDPFQKSHIAVMALRKVGKEILKDLWLACGPVPEHLDNRYHLHSGQRTENPGHAARHRQRKSA